MLLTAASSAPAAEAEDCEKSCSSPKIKGALLKIEQMIFKFIAQAGIQLIEEIPLDSEYFDRFVVNHQRPLTAAISRCLPLRR